MPVPNTQQWISAVLVVPAQHFLLSTYQFGCFGCACAANLILKQSQTWKYVFLLMPVQQISLSNMSLAALVVPMH